jgi:hypothetical protein
MECTECDENLILIFFSLYMRIAEDEQIYAVHN